MQWLSSLARIGICVVLGALAGVYFGNSLVGVAIALILLLLYSTLQARRVWHWLKDTSRPPPDVSGIWGEIVTHVYRQERAASDTEKQLESTVDYLLQSFAAMRDGVVIVEHDGAIRWCNDAAQPLLGLRFPDDIGQALTNLVRVPEFNRYMREGDFTEPLTFASGINDRHLMLVATRFAEGDILLFIRDVTDRVLTERMRRDFVGNVSHELRTPLTVITGYLGTLLGDTSGLPEHYVRALQQMDTQAERMENLLKDLLWLTRIETTEHDEKRERVNISTLLHELQDEMSNLYPDNPLQLEIDCTATVPGDYRELYSAVSNLVINAYKYGGADRPVIASWHKAGEDYVLAVKDSGAGIDSAHVPRLTERFYRVDDSRSSTTGGTGLGLAIVKHVAAAHGGHLKIESRLGQGSTFSLVLPARP